jgi:ribosomal protein S18 acetylase RimI-like enzyme
MERSKPSIQIRIALPEDASSIAMVLHQSFVEYESSYTPEAFAATTPTGDQILRRMMEGPVWVAVHDDLILGTVSVVPEGESLYIRGMAILPTARGYGIGELLLRHVESYACARNHKRLFLSTTPFLSRAIRLYERFGFRRSSEGPHDLCGTPLFTMEKAI